MVFTLLALTNVLINIDHGIIPAGIDYLKIATSEIEASLHINDSGLGLLGSLVYAGIVTVALFAGKIFFLVNARWLLIISYVGMLVNLSLFTIPYPNNTTWPYYLFRYLTGVS